jgi:hypothetical protein
MSETSRKERIYGLLARFETPHDLVTASRQVRQAGYSRWDAHCPFPVHGLEGAMGLGRSYVSWFSFILGMAGAAAGMLLQWWVSTEAYPLVISGKPFFSWPAFVPIMFECGVLGGALGAVLGFFVQSRMPRPHHALFSSRAFERVTDDGFFISIEADDPEFDGDGTKELLLRAGASEIETVTDVGTETEVETLFKRWRKQAQ